MDYLNVGVSIANIDKAITTHKLWIANFRSSLITGIEDESVSRIKQDGHCELGRWLYSLGNVTIEHRRYVDTVCILHSKFHYVAHRTVVKASQGYKDEALRSLDNGDLSTASMELMLALMKWKDVLKPK
jgi:hypothetical protein